MSRWRTRSLSIGKPGFRRPPPPKVPSELDFSTMSESSSRGASEEDIHFIEEICRDIALKNRSAVLPYAALARALGDALVIHRVSKDDGRTVALAAGIDRGRELDLFLVAVAFSHRRTGIAGRLLDHLIREHMGSGGGRRMIANCWPGSGGGPGALLSSGFCTAPGKVRWTRDRLDPTPAAPLGATWIHLGSEPLDRRARLLGGALAAWPGDADPGPMLAALSVAPSGGAWVGLVDDEVKAVWAGTLTGDAYMVLVAYEREMARGTCLADGFNHVLEAARKLGAKRIVAESSIPTSRVAPVLTELGFRSIEAAAGFLAGTPGHAYKGNAFAL